MVYSIRVRGIINYTMNLIRIRMVCISNLFRVCISVGYQIQVWGVEHTEQSGNRDID